MTEPILTDEDLQIWCQFERAARSWGLTRSHARKVDAARRAVDEMAAIAPGAYVALSGGKDSTALVYLLADLGFSGRAMSVKDDLDFPGEEEHVRAICGSLGMALDVLRPTFSLQKWLADHGRALTADEDFHGRGSAFSREAFYSVVDCYREAAGSPGVYLGLRQEESRGRRANRARRGLTYCKANGESVCQPIADWSGLDVFAFLFQRDAPILDVYRCCRIHESPDRVRKSWWLPGAACRRGGMVWLKTYYPSLFYRLKMLLPDAGRMA